MNILVPTDFSECAKNALELACKLGSKLNAKIHLYHSTNLPEEWEDLDIEDKMIDTINNTIAASIIKKLEEEAKIVKEYNLDYRIHYTGGKYLKNIEEIIDEVEIDLVVVGSNGASGKEEWFLGSNTQKLIRKIHKDILVVKNKVQDIEFDKILFASNLSLKDKEMFVDFLEFIKLFPVKELHILVVDTFGFFSQPSILIYEALKDFKSLARDFNCKTHFISNYSVESGIRRFAADNEIKLIGISNVTRNPIKRLFQGSNVEFLINHSDVPVYCLDKERN